MFRSPEEEARELAKELRELKELLRGISGKIAQIEARARRAFPTTFAKMARPSSGGQKPTDPPTISPQEALRLYDDLVQLAKGGNKNEAQDRLQEMMLPDLALLARELGVSLGKSKPSRKTLVNGVLGRISESMMLSTSGLRQRSEKAEDVGGERSKPEQEGIQPRSSEGSAQKDGSAG